MHLSSLVRHSEAFFTQLGKFLLLFLFGVLFYSFIDNISLSTRSHFRGFPLPFFVMGGSLFLVFIISFFIFPYVETRQSVETENRRSGRLMPLLRTPKFITTLFMLLLGSLSIGFLEPSIQLHLKPVTKKKFHIQKTLFLAHLIF